MFSPLPSFTKQQLAEQSLAELAILHRQRLETTTNEAWIQAYNRFVRRGLGGTLLFQRAGRHEIFSYNVCPFLD
ncbi:hypothetical protein H0H93_013183, partial [Arthromyces matolae]